VGQWHKTLVVTSCITKRQVRIFKSLVGPAIVTDTPPEVLKSK